MPFFFTKVVWCSSTNTCIANFKKKKRRRRRSAGAGFYMGGTNGSYHLNKNLQTQQTALLTSTASNFPNQDV